MLDLNTPCDNCPFRKGMGSVYHLSRFRIEQMIKGDAFLCHKTVKWLKADTIDQKEQQCAGMMAMLASCDQSNRIMELGKKFHQLELSKLDYKNSYSSVEEAILDHKDRHGD